MKLIAFTIDDYVKIKLRRNSKVNELQIIDNLTIALNDLKQDFKCV